MTGTRTNVKQQKLTHKPALEPQQRRAESTPSASVTAALERLVTDPDPLAGLCMAVLAGRGVICRLLVSAGLGVICMRVAVTGSFDMFGRTLDPVLAE